MIVKDLDIAMYVRVFSNSIPRSPSLNLIMSPSEAFSIAETNSSILFTVQVLPSVSANRLVAELALARVIAVEGDVTYSKVPDISLLYQLLISDMNDHPSIDPSTKYLEEAPTEE